MCADGIRLVGKRSKAAAPDIAIHAHSRVAGAQRLDELEPLPPSGMITSVTTTAGWRSCVILQAGLTELATANRESGVLEHAADGNPTTSGSIVDNQNRCHLTLSSQPGPLRRQIQLKRAGRALVGPQPPASRP